MLFDQVTRLEQLLPETVMLRFTCQGGKCAQINPNSPCNSGTMTVAVKPTEE